MQSHVTSAQLGHIGTQKKILSPLIGQKFKMANGKQSSDWTIIQDGRWACDWTKIQDGRENRTGLNKMKFSDWRKFKFKFSLM